MGFLLRFSRNTGRRVEKVKAAIIGAGVIGLAVAERLSRQIDGDVIVFERHEKFGQETSSRNSEVIHAGIYYSKNSLKSTLCLRGNKMLYEFCIANGIKYNRCGKIIVSTNMEEAEKIKAIYANAVSVGVPDLKLLNKEEIKELEPNIYALNGIFSGSTGIIDSHGLMSCLYNKSKDNGVMFAFKNEVGLIGKNKEGYIINIVDGDKILSEIVINCGGLFSDKIAKTAGFDIDKLGYSIYFCKGDYFSINGSTGKLKHLVYPVPHEEGHGLGVHATLDLQGYIRLGPDANYVDAINYDIDAGKRKYFYESAKNYLPWLKESALMPDTSGIRPKLQGLGEGIRDFIIREESDNGFPGFINLIGIESPGLTASLAIGEFIRNLVK